jgi:mRNA interferase MazF
MEARLKRGEIWTAAGGPDYAGKPRPFVLVQEDESDIMTSVTVCGFTSNVSAVPLFRVPIAPTDRNGLALPSHVMVDKITTIPTAKLGHRIGRLSDEDLIRVNQALKLHLGLTG